MHCRNSVLNGYTQIFVTTVDRDKINDHFPGFVFFIIYKVEKNVTIKRNDGSDYELGKLVNVIDWITHPLAILVTQDEIKWFRTMPRQSSGSILVVFWAITSFLLYLSYLSNFQVSGNDK